MRLNQQYISVIKQSFEDVFQSGEVYLFGSRIDDSKKRGDIDLYLILNNKINLFRKKLKFLAKIKKVLGEQKIDIIFNINDNRLVEKEAKKWGIIL